MKKYTEPFIEIIEIDSADLILSSSIIDDGTQDSITELDAAGFID